MRNCWALKKEFFDIIKLPLQREKSPEPKLFCRYCKENGHLIENCPRRPKPEANTSGSWRNPKNESTPSVKSEQKGFKPENRSLNWIKVESLEMQK